MGIIPWLVIVVICLIIIKSLLGFIRGGKITWHMEMRDSRFSAELFYALLIIYSTVIIGFGLIYFIISFHGIILVEGEELREVSVLGSIIHSVYFSGATMLTIGYGDITPIGIGRFIALIEALIGYVLPTAFVLRLVQSHQRSRDK
ncbi:two pore domain potassium channel family protein [Virgibacillus sp. NKC19-16]|uniref:potassium channel family protein n=1 Tax=Virgibacillus salidurans TaxID=2831673 RepID=UPI001F2449DB|nr:potassium channel family protein [Virgibacillus sp. NKC19-16]UJL47321.1 two pore domain potassium channel family protein [Virgibacillus sp. NKC19-16]